nr:MAG TPA: hypothetical protein [Caudoviricetes sp.]
MTFRGRSFFIPSGALPSRTSDILYRVRDERVLFFMPSTRR